LWFSPVIFSNYIEFSYPSAKQSEAKQSLIGLEIKASPFLDGAIGDLN
jgi:hypothetical protein